MNIALLYYSGAGNTEFIAKHLKSKLQEQGHTIYFKRVTQAFFQDVEVWQKEWTDNPNSSIDLYVIGFPIYDFSAPELIKQAVAKLPSTSQSVAYFCTKAFMSADAIHELNSISLSKGYRTIAALELVMPGTDALAFGAPKNSGTAKLLKAFHSRRIGGKLDHFIHSITQGNIKKVQNKWYTPLSQIIPEKVKKDIHNQYTRFIPEFYADAEACISCMRCVNECPQQNIQFADKAGITFGTECDMCLRCLHRCPTEAIQVGSRTQGNERYNKVEVSL